VNKARKLLALVVGLTLFLGLMMCVITPGQGEASNLRTTYEVLKADYNHFLQQFYNAGVTEPEIESFLTALDAEVLRRGPLSEANLNNVLAKSILAVGSKSQHKSVFNAMLDILDAEIDEFLLTGQIPQSLMPLRNAIRDSLLGTTVPVPPSSSPGGGGAAPVPSGDGQLAEVERQLAEGKQQVTLTAGTGATGLTVSGAVLNRLARAGQSLDVLIGTATFRLPPGALELVDGDKLSLAARSLNTTQAANAIQAVGSNRKLVGPVYELECSTEASVLEVRFKKPVTVIMSYEGVDMAGIDEGRLDLYRFHEGQRQWQRLSGVVDREKKTVAISLTSFSKFAIMSEIPAPAAVPANDKVFTDLAGHWAAEDVYQMVRLGLVAGVSETQYAPNRNITRAEFAALLVRALGIDTSGATAQQFADVKPDRWYFQVVKGAARAGLVSGYSVTTFGPNDLITREQMAAMVSRSLAYKGKGVVLTESEVDDLLSKFRDRNEISGWAQRVVAEVVEREIMSGRAAGSLAPGANTTRAEAAVIVLRLHKQL